MVRPRQFFSILTWKCASRYSGVRFFLCPLQSYLRTRRFSEVTFRPSRHTKPWKTQHFATSLTFRAIVASFYWLSCNCIFFLLTLLLLCFFIFWLCYSALLFQLSILSEVRLLNFLRLLDSSYLTLLLLDSSINIKLYHYMTLLWLDSTITWPYFYLLLLDSISSYIGRFSTKLSYRLVIKIFSSGSKVADKDTRDHLYAKF